MSGRIPWPVPEPHLPTGVHPALAAATRAATDAFRAAREAYDRAQLAEKVQVGADGTPTMRLDILVDTAIAEVVNAHRINLLSEELGSIDNGSAVTLVTDPVDGTANAASGVPLSAFAGVIAVDGVPTEALTSWLDTGRCWHTVAGQPSPYRTNGRTELDGAAVSLLRPQPHIADAWWRVATRAARIRILSTSCLEAVLVAEGSTDAFADAGSDTHRIVDLAAAMVTVPAAGGAVIDVHGRPLEIDPDLTRRWSGVVAATPRLAEELAETIRGTEDR
ncbi:inositol monophosphatase family protein [Streptomyces rugosispiralis]|uniref:Inositol monophosphatase n=1 Tax=Streptomyces rugosispiralis TaxID=2967341 RepID=A0ABT1UR95_9ACTN|nr:inositol monophosphatase family protein [Streptomyces rugosispiralis]MCQ8187080.1 inositol monophosphatase [Streptomyces rugosispiralis]